MPIERLDLRVRTMLGKANQAARVSRAHNRQVCHGPSGPCSCPCKVCRSYRQKDPAPPQSVEVPGESATARAIRLIREDERVRCIATIRRYLLFNDQRAVSWHEVQDCIDAIRAPEARDED
jgi:hypothetical protein